MADKVIVEVGRIDASIMPPSFGFPLVDALINQGNDLANVAGAANNASTDAEKAIEQNKEQDLSIKQNSDDINTNSKAIAKNTDSISNIANDLSQHESDKSAHGATGDIVGNEDFAGLSVGGVVLLASEVLPVKLLPIELADAPAEYNQEHAQSLVAAIRLLAENQATVNNTLSGIITAMQNAKQMNKEVTP